MQQACHNINESKLRLRSTSFGRNPQLLSEDLASRGARNRVHILDTWIRSVNFRGQAGDDDNYLLSIACSAPPGLSTTNGCLEKVALRG